MAGLSTGLKKLLTITRCTVDAGKVTPSSDKFEVMLNPSEFSHDHGISYSGGGSASKGSSSCGKQVIGQSGAETKFSSTDAEKLSFELVFDGTGVVNLPVAGLGSPPVKDQIKALKEIVYDYKGDNHEPNVVQIIWGKFIFNGRLESMSVKYTLFKPSGEPLRAKIPFSFTGHVPKEEEALNANKSSPDLTHIIEVKAGDTLPMLCYRIYNNCSYYTEVARANNISNFQYIKPGTKLHFPPLR